MTLFEVLGVAPRATQEEIRKAYLKGAKENHPDRHPDCAERFKALTEAYGVLKDNEARRAYVKRLILEGGSTNQTKKRMCNACEGTGKQYLQVSFTRSEPRTCEKCEGSGYE